MHGTGTKARRHEGTKGKSAVLMCLGASAIATLPSVGFAAEVKGLDGVGDELLVQELSRYGMDGLLDRYFATHQAAASEQASVRAMMSIRLLLNGGERLPAAQRQQIVQQILGGADTIVPTLNDPRQLMQLATALITAAMERNANVIEYWGENPRSQAELRPVAELVAKVLDLCSARAREMADKLVGKFGNNPSRTQQQEYDLLDRLARLAHYNRLMADYYRAMSLPAGDPRRMQIADGAIEGLKEFDAPDSDVQPQVRARIGRLQMVKGDYAAAKRTLQTLAASPDQQIVPAPNVFQQDDARYFSVVCDVLAGNVDAAAAGIQTLQAWEAHNLPHDKQTRDAVEASTAMLNYRLEKLRFQRAPDDAARQAAQARASAILQQLAKDRPDLSFVILEQLAKSLPDDAKLESLDPVMLRALVQQGMVEQIKPEGVAVNRKMIDRALGAADELVARRGREGVDAELVDEAAIAIPQFHEKLGRDAEAVRAYLVYLETTHSETNKAAALRNALAAIGRLRVADPQAAEALLDRTLPVAVYKLGRRDLAYDLGRRLQQAGKYGDAVDAYRLVPESEARYLAARYYQMEAMERELATAGSGMDPKDRSARLLVLRDLASDVQKHTAEARKAGGPGAQQNAFMEARARLILAGLLKESDPAGAIAALDGFERAVAGIRAEDELIAAALSLRVGSQIGTGRSVEATQSLLQLLQTREGNQGASIVHGLLAKLDADLDVAKKAGQTEKSRSLLAARAALSGPLVDWARTNKDPKIQQATYRYMVYDAQTKQQAAMAEPDAAKRATGLRQALELYNKLMDADGIRRWAATVDAAKVDVEYGDVNVHLAKAQVLFELAEYKEAASRFGRLLEDRKLGTPRIISTKDGEVISEDNPQYWEAMYKLYRANVEMARDGNNPDGAKLLEETKSGLKRLYIREGDGVGGEGWKGQFEELRKELIPSFHVGSHT